MNAPLSGKYIEFLQLKGRGVAYLACAFWPLRSALGLLDLFPYPPTHILTEEVAVGPAFLT